MSAKRSLPIQFFDPKQDYGVVDRRLPHWSQAGTIAFITWRTWDSIPGPVLATWLSERNAWLKAHGVAAETDNWQVRIKSLGSNDRQQFQLDVSDRWNDHLDACHGTCVLRRPEISQVIADSFLYFDGDRYELTDFVVMPNHVHLLVAFPDHESMLRQCESWKRFTATKINKMLNRTGHFWQSDGFDHLVRSDEQFDYLRRYIGDNPRRANLRESEYRHWSKPL